MVYDFGVAELTEPSQWRVVVFTEVDILIVGFLFTCILRQKWLHRKGVSAETKETDEQAINVINYIICIQYSFQDCSFFPFLFMRIVRIPR